MKIDQILRQSVANAIASINNNLVQNVNPFRGNVDITDIMGLQSLGVKVDSKDPLSENLANAGTMNCADKAEKLD